MNKLVLVSIVFSLMGIGQVAHAKYSCADKAVKWAVVRHVYAVEKILDPYPTDPIRITGYLDRDKKSGEVKWGRVNSWLLGPNAETRTLTVEKTDTGTATISILLCGYTWPGTKEEWKEKLRVENLTLTTGQSTKLLREHKPGTKVTLKHTPATSSTRTIYVVVMEPESKWRSAKYNISQASQP